MEAKTWFIIGTSLFMGAGGGHALLTLLDMVRPTFFTPIDGAVRSAMETTGFRFRRLFPGNDDVTPTMWRIWLGFNASHGIGAFAFGLLCLLIAVHDFALVTSIGALRPLTIAVSGAYFALSLRFWFYAPALITGGACACFTIAALTA
ncbi:MAG: hypothetical protein ABW167_15480 [Baekduia sp.]